VYELRDDDPTYPDAVSDAQVRRDRHFDDALDGPGRSIIGDALPGTRAADGAGYRSADGAAMTCEYRSGRERDRAGGRERALLALRADGSSPVLGGVAVLGSGGPSEEAHYCHSGRLFASRLGVRSAERG
jgi:hypothetical protein